MRLSTLRESMRRLPDLPLLGVALVIFAAMFLQFFGTTILSGFRLLSGNEGDAALVAFLHEHVFQSLGGHASLRNPPFYFPTPGVLGYTDTFLLNQIFYAPLRLLGFDPFLAIQLTYMALALMGGTTFALLLVRFFGVRPWLALAAAAIFAFGHALYLKTGHPQHLSIHFLPVVACLLLTSILRAQSRLSGAAFAFGAGLLYGLIFVTGYYMAWFFAFFLLFALPVFLVVDRVALIAFAREHKHRLLVTLGGMTIGFLPGAALVLWIYLPAIGALRSLTAQNFAATAATFRDILNVSDTNLLWGALLRHAKLVSMDRLQLTEVTLAVPPLLVAATLVGMILVMRRRTPATYEKMAASLCAAVLFGYVMVYLFTISVKGVSLFMLAQKIVPGALAIRVGFRSQVMSAMFITLAGAVAAEAWLRRRQSFNGVAKTSVLVLGIGVVLALEEVNLRPQALLDRIQENARLAAVPSPPSACRVFAIYDDGSRMLQAIHVDAMRISQRFGLPTVNGYSGGVPPGWDMSNVWDQPYLDRVRAWVRRNGVAGPICLYEATSRSWRAID